MNAATMECAPLAAKCMEFCRHLESQGRAFKFSLSVGTNFDFTLDTREEVTFSKEVKKKASPSTMRRNVKRKELFLKKKCLTPSVAEKVSPNGASEEEAVEDASVEETHLQKKSFICNQCENVFSTENGLKIHIGKTHKTEMLRSSSPAPSLEVSPLKEQLREEHGCQVTTCTKCSQTFKTDYQLKNHWGDGNHVPSFFKCQGNPPPRLKS